MHIPASLHKACCLPLGCSFPLPATALCFLHKAVQKCRPIMYPPAGKYAVVCGFTAHIAPRGDSSWAPPHLPLLHVSQWVQPRKFRAALPCSALLWAFEIPVCLVRSHLQACSFCPCPGNFTGAPARKILTDTAEIICYNLEKLSNLISN